MEQTASGASVALVTALLAAALVWSEARYFLSPGYSFKFVPDADYEAKLTINVDLTVAMPCDREYRLSGLLSLKGKTFFLHSQSPIETI